MNTDEIKVDGWEGIICSEQRNVIMGYRTEPRLMQFMYNKLDGLTITETTRHQLQDTKHYMDIDWEEAKQVLEAWI